MTTVSLADIADIHGGGRLKLTGHDFVQQGFPAFGAGGQNGYVSIAEYTGVSAVILSSIGARCGKAFLAQGNWTSLANTQVIIPDREEVDPRFLWHQLNDESRWLRSGSAQPFIKPSDVKKHRIFMPCLSEQRRIAAILDQADTLRAKRRQTLARLDDLTQSIFFEMFADVQTAITFGDVIADGPTNGLYRPASDYGSGTPILRIDGFDGGILKKQAWKRLRTTAAEEKRYGLADGDIVINRVNALSHLGKSALIEGLSEPAVYESNMMRLRLDTGMVNPRFVMAWLQTRDVKQQILRKSKKAINQASINQTDVRSLQMPLPGGSEQHLFARRVNEAYVRQAVLQQAESRTDELIRSLQSRAFSGQL